MKGGHTMEVIISKKPAGVRSAAGNCCGGIMIT